MSKCVVITDTPGSRGAESTSHTVMAVYEDGLCESLNICGQHKSILGNIYLGRIDNIVKNINSAFVSIDKDSKPYSTKEGIGYYSLAANTRHYFFNPKNNDRPNQGDAVLVQVAKDAAKNKPATLTSKIELAGLYLVLSLDVQGVHVSKKIKGILGNADKSDISSISDNETSDIRNSNDSSSDLQKISKLENENRQFEIFENSHDILELKSYLESMLAEYKDSVASSPVQDIIPGFIIRSNVVNLSSADAAIDEAGKLLTAFTDIIKKALYSKAPCMLHEAEPDYIRLIDDIALDEIDKIITDDEGVYENLCAQYLCTQYSGGQYSSDTSKVPDSKASKVHDRKIPENVEMSKKNNATDNISNATGIRIELYKDDLLSLYNLYDVRKQIEDALSRKVWLKCGGYIVIDVTEAMTVIDVNSGKYVTKKHDAQAMQNAFFTVNSQAAVEITRQLRLRNISGMVMVDFINMDDEENVDAILKLLRQEFKKDKVTTTVVDITRLGIVEITRKRTGMPLAESIYSVSYN